MWPRVKHSFSHLKSKTDRVCELLPAVTLHLGSWCPLVFESPKNLLHSGREGRTVLPALRVWLLSGRGSDFSSVTGKGGRNQVSNKNNKLWKKMSQHIFKPGWKGAWRIAFLPPHSTTAKRDHTRNISHGRLGTLPRETVPKEEGGGQGSCFTGPGQCCCRMEGAQHRPPTLCGHIKVQSICTKQCHFSCMEGGDDLSPAQHHFEAILLEKFIFKYLRKSPILKNFWCEIFLFLFSSNHQRDVFWFCQPT